MSYRSRLMPSTLFSNLWPDREDPDRKWKYLCRFCGKPAVSPKRYYCSDHCSDMCQLSVNWETAKGIAVRNAEYKCQFPGCHGHAEDCHHIFPVKKIHRLSWDLLKEWGLYYHDRDDLEAKKKLNHTFAVLYTLMFLDVNNLIYYCYEHHKMIHAADKRATNVYAYGAPYEVARTYWAKFWDMANREHYTKKLDEWF